MGAVLSWRDYMKILLKWLVYIVIFVSFLLVGYVLIFSLDVMVSGVVWLSFIFLCFLIFCAGIFGLVMGHLNLIKLRNRIEVSILMIFSIMLGIGLSIVLFINVVLDYEMKDKNYTLEEKTRYLASEFLQVPSQKNVSKEELNDITYYFSADKEQFVEKFHTYLLAEKDNFDRVFGQEDLNPLMIEIHKDSKLFQANFLVPKDVGGYYQTLNTSLHIIPNEGTWENLFLHEYTHYRIHQFSQKHNLPLQRLPIWFQEGSAEFFGNEKIEGINLEAIQILDFHLLDSSSSFQETRGGYYNPYEQSFLAVNSLVNNHGVEIIPELMMSKTIDEFYLNLENVTGKSLSEYQESLVSDLLDEQEEIGKHFALAYDAIEEKNYEKAESVLAIIKEIGSERDIDLAEDLIIQINVEQGLYENVIKLIEVKNTKENDGYETNNLLILTESYLVLGHTEKALESIKKAEESIVQSRLTHRYIEKIDSALDAYKQINSNNPVPGYKKLIEEELITNEYTEKDLLKQLNAKYPNEF